MPIDPINRRVLGLAVLLFLTPLAADAAASAAAAADGRALLPGRDAPDAVLSAPAPQGPEREPDSAWLLRTGFKKGLLDTVLEDERSAAPDVAVLQAGFYPAWPDLLAAFREPWVFVGHDDIALLSRTKPVLIVPTGGLYGTSRSVFFRAALAEYAASGGTVICFSQQKGEDFSSLPVPDPFALEAAGWADDSGPLFRASVIQAAHPALAGMRSATPSIHTAGSFTTLPPEAETWLARSDGFGVVAVYTLGKGRVVLAALYPDVASDGGFLTDDERIFLRDLIAWAKSPGTASAAPGERVTLPVTVTGPGKGPAQSVRIMIAAPGQDAALVDTVMKVSVTERVRASFPLAFTVPAGAAQGMYRTEYVLLDESNKPVSPRVEAVQGSIVIGRAPVARPLKRSPRPLAAFPATISLTAAALPPGAGGRASKVTLAVTASSPVPAGQILVAAAGNREQYFQLSNNRAEIAFDLPSAEAGPYVPCSVRHANGRVLARTSVAVAAPKTAGIALDRSAYAPGDKAVIRMPGTAAGELTVTGLGATHSSMIRRGESIELAVPALPSGAYPLSWHFVSLDGAEESGEAQVLVAGPSPVFRGASIGGMTDGKVRKVDVSLALTSPSRGTGIVELSLLRPDGEVEKLSGANIELAAGKQEIPLALSFVPKTAGIHELRYALYVPLPEGAGFTKKTVVVAAGRELLDSGDVAVLGISPLRPVHYENAGAAEVSAVIYNAGGKRTIETFANGKRIAKQKIDQPGITILSTEMTGLRPGANVVRVRAEGGRFDSVRERPLTYGGRLADLVPRIELPAFRTATLPVSLTVKNRGKSASLPSTVALYESDDGRKRVLIGSAQIAALPPGSEQTVEIPWSLVKRSGARSVAAEVDPGGTVPEADRRNNLATANVTVPDIIVSALPSGSVIASDAAFSVALTIVNLTASTVASPLATIAVFGPTGRPVTKETISLPDLEPGIERAIRKDLSLASPPAGAYAIQASVAGKAPLTSASATFTVLPTLALRGSLDGTPDRASSCRPFPISYSVESSGNVPATAGSLKIELLSDSGSPAFARQVPLTLKPSHLTIEKLSLPQGTYRARISASAVNEQLRLSRDLLLAEKTVTLGGPVQVRRITGAVPRVLLWKGADRNTVERALLSTIVKQAFEGEPVFVKVVEGASEFRSQAERGLFNVFILFEVDGAQEDWDWLKSIVSGGRALLIIGETPDAQKAAEAFGFTFGDALPDQQRVLALSGKAAIELGGTIPVQGRILQPRKKKAETVAVVQGTGYPAALIDRTEPGTVAVLPFSFVTSARFSGSTAMYGLALRSATRSLTPEQEKESTAAAEGLIVSSLSGPVKSRVHATLPPGSRPIWASEGGVISGNGVTFDVLAGRDEKTLLYLYEPAGEGRDRPVHTVSFECDGSFANQGNIE